MKVNFQRLDSLFYEQSLANARLCHCYCWDLRKERDSNPRYLAVRRFSRPVQSITLPSFQISCALRIRRCKIGFFFRTIQIFHQNISEFHQKEPRPKDAALPLQQISEYHHSVYPFMTSFIAFFCLSTFLTLLATSFDVIPFSVCSQPVSWSQPVVSHSRIVD